MVVLVIILGLSESGKIHGPEPLAKVGIGRKIEIGLALQSERQNWSVERVEASSVVGPNIVGEQGRPPGQDWAAFRPEAVIQGVANLANVHAVHKSSTGSESGADIVVVRVVVQVG